MRELKFRWYGLDYPYDPVTDQISDKAVIAMVYSDIFKETHGLSEFFDYIQDGSPVMQFTGLLDKNGKEVFSSDIVTDGINPPFVVDLWNFPLMVRLSEIDFETIGNIYENPELIK